MALNAGPFAYAEQDLPASLVVALVALPLCLGVAVASDAPPLAGLVTGIVGGVLVAWLSGSQLANLPLAALAAVSIHVGVKLVSHSPVRSMLRQPAAQWIPFVATIGAVVLTDLSIGVLIGMAIAIFFILRAHLDSAFFLERQERTSQADHMTIRLELTPSVSFLHPPSVSKTLHTLPPGSTVEIDATRARHVHPDIVELIHELEDTANEREIEVVVLGAERLESAAGLRRKKDRNPQTEDMVKP